MMTMIKVVVLMAFLLGRDVPRLVVPPLPRNRTFYRQEDWRSG